LNAHTPSGARRLKVLVSKVGLDGHDRGIKVVAKGLADAGFEVVYLGVHQTVESVVATALQEDVDVIALSILSGSHMELTRDLMAAMKEKGIHKPVVLGGVIPSRDIEPLKKLGVLAIYGPGTSLSSIAKAVEEASKKSEVAA